MEMTSHKGAPLALQTVASELSTLHGMANHLVLLAGTQPARQTAVRWFGSLPTQIQVDLIKSVGRDTSAAVELIMLAPDAGTILPHLGLGIVRRVCDSRPVLLECLPPKRLATMVRITKHPSAKLEWLSIITAWNDDQVGAMEAFIDELDAIEIADWYVTKLRLSHLSRLRDALDDPDELEDLLDDDLPFLRVVYTARPEMYRTVIGQLMLRLGDRWERRSRLRTLDELQRQHWPGFARDLHDRRK